MRAHLVKSAAALSGVQDDAIAPKTQTHEQARHSHSSHLETAATPLHFQYITKAHMSKQEAMRAHEILNAPLRETLATTQVGQTQVTCHLLIGRESLCA